MKITTEQLQKLLNQNLTEDYWIFELGVGYVYNNVSNNVRYSAPYPEYGKLLWSQIESNIQGLLCKDGKPNSIIEEIINGDIRSLAEAILSIIIARYEMTLALAIPLTAIVIKKGILNFCDENKDEQLSSETIKEILKTKSLRLNNKGKKHGQKKKKN
jgi:hypothetical protein